MKLSAIFLNVATVATLLSAGAASAATELVVNGSFENDPISSSWAQVSSVTGWTSSASDNSAFEIQKGTTQGGVSGFMPAADNGVQYLELNTDRLTSISQTINTTAGSNYSLSFAYSGRPDTAGNASSLMNVYWGNTLLTTSPLVGTTTPTWQTFSQTVSALGSSTVLRFESVGPISSPTYGSYLDNVSVSAVPEPQTYAMMMLGLGLMGFIARRKRQA